MKLYISRIVFYTCFCSLFIGLCVKGDVCISTWTQFPGQFSTGAEHQDANSLQECLAYCEYRSDCLAVDYNTAYDERCWVHMNPDDLLPENVYGSNGATQYQLNRTCSFNSSDCLLVWTRRAQTHSLNAIQVPYWTEYDCFSFCRYTPGCVAVDFDPTSGPPCWFHTSYVDLIPENTYDDSATSVQYRMNRTCPGPSRNDTTVFEVGRCVGQSFQNLVNCPSDYEIHIIEASYKIHPLCCFDLNDSADIPDFSSSPIKLNVLNMDDNDYISGIQACEGNRSCSLISKAYVSDGINNVYCPQKIHQTNYVFLRYGCNKKGHIDPSTTKSATLLPIPSVDFSQMQVTGTHRATMMKSDGQDNTTTTAAMVPNGSQQSSSREYVVLAGFGVALGALALLIIIIVGVLWFWRKRKEEQRVSNHMAAYPMYTNTTSSFNDDSMNNNRYNEQRKGATHLDYPGGVTASNA